MAEGTRYDACTPRPGRDKTWWHKVGSAWKNAEGRITVYLDSLPVPDKEGRIAIMLFEPRDKEQQEGERRQNTQRQQSAGRAGARRRDDLDDDEIPF